MPGVLRLMLAARPPPTRRPRQATVARAAIVARDRAMLLLGFGAALRRSELVALTLGDVETVPGRGLKLLVRRSQDRPARPGPRHRRLGQSGRTRRLPARRARDLARASPHRRGSRLDRHPDRARRAPVVLRRHQGRAGSPAQALSDKAVARLVKQAARDAGLDPERYSGHSLRAGLATAAGDAGAGLAELMRQTRHKSTEVALGYLRPADLWRNNVTEGVFRLKGGGKD